MRAYRRPIPVVCKNTRYWRAFVRDNWENISAYVGKYKIQIKDRRYFYVSWDFPDKLQGLILEEAILYNCQPSDVFMDLLRSRFKDVDVNIKEIWN